MHNESGPVADSRERVLELERQVADLEQAVDSRQRIGVCIGLLASYLNCSPGQAWEFLAWLSQNTNTKARTVAQVLIDLHCGTLAPGDHELAETLVRLLPQLAAADTSRRPTGGDYDEPRQVPIGVVCPLRPVAGLPEGLPQSMAAGL